MMYRVLLTDNITPEAVAVFETYGDIEAVATGTLPPAELKQTIADFDGIVIRTPTRLTADVLQAARRLKFIGRAGVGTDNIDIDAATAAGIVVMNAPTGNTVSTAEFTIGLMLSLARWIPAAHNSVTGGLWDRKTYRGMELSGKTLGIVGLGRVGREVASRMRAFGMNIVAFDPYVAGDVFHETGATQVNMEELLRQSHLVTIHVPFTEKTRILINDRELALMPDGALLVNCSRGGIVSEDALVKALETGKLAGVALDVYENEPPGDHPLFRHPRCVFAPHLGAATGEARVRVATDAAKAVAEALTTGRTRNAVNRPGERPVEKDVNRRDGRA
jgi:D-3-phosphoglycerate dehydrogenase